MNWKPEEEQPPSKKARTDTSIHGARRENWALVLPITETGDKLVDAMAQRRIGNDTLIRDLKLAMGQVGVASVNGISVYFACVEGKGFTCKEKLRLTNLAIRTVKWDMRQKGLYQIAFPCHRRDDKLGRRFNDYIRNGLLKAETGIMNPGEAHLRQKYLFFGLFAPKKGGTYPLGPKKGTIPPPPRKKA